MKKPQKSAPGRTVEGEETVAEPSEARLRVWLLTAAAFVVPPLLLLLYYKTMFFGLVNPDAMDYAQLGRNLGSGRGFVTQILRPMAMDPDASVLRQPDITHGPLFPFFLALAFGALGARDSVVAAVSAFFFLATIPVIYILGTRMFSRRVGLVTAGIFTFNALMLEYAVSGLHITLYVFLTTCLLAVLYHLALFARDRAGRQEVPVPRALLVMAGLLTGLLYLTDPIFAWVGIVSIGSVFWLLGPARLRGAAWFAVPLLLLALPWMWRNWALAGNPVFGLRGLELCMNTRDHYPGYVAYRMTPGDVVPGLGLFKAVVNKILLGAGQVIQSFPQVTASWVLAFFLPSLLFRFTDPAVNTLRRVLMLCFLGIFMGALLFTLQMPLFVSTIPAMLVFAVAFLIHLLQQAQLGRGSSAFAVGLLVVAVVYPLASEMTLLEKPRPVAEREAARSLAQNTQKTEVTLSDQPWIVAWYGDRPALWIPADSGKIKDYRQAPVGARWLFLTEGARSLSPDWNLVYSRCMTWNMAAIQARAARQAVPEGLMIRTEKDRLPLLEALDGFVWLRPDEDAPPSAVVAAIPLPAGKAGLRSGIPGRLPRYAGAATGVSRRLREPGIVSDGGRR